MNGGGRLPHGTGSMHCSDGSKPCREGQGMPSADLVAVHCEVPVRVTCLGASQDAERNPQDAPQGDAHEERVNATKWVGRDGFPTINKNIHLFNIINSYCTLRSELGSYSASTKLAAVPRLPNEQAEHT
eukprot:2528738-Pleurochrysis_carterae.AAC.2